jgi:uncharacterized peroxidase-related enzyme
MTRTSWPFNFNKGEKRMTPRIQLLDPATTTGPVRDIFDSVKSKIGMVPNLYRVLGHSPAALSAYLAINDRLSGATLSAATREKIALAVSQRNGCGYCLSAHTMIASKMANVPEAEIAAARDAKGANDHETALLSFAAALVDRRARLSDEELASARAAGVTDVELVETVGLVAALTFSNYMNHIARTPIDFPPAANLPKED